jgi:hypothetical protein
VYEFGFCSQLKNLGARAPFGIHTGLQSEYHQEKRADEKQNGLEYKL